MRFISIKVSDKHRWWRNPVWEPLCLGTTTLPPFSPPSQSRRTADVLCCRKVNSTLQRRIGPLLGHSAPRAVRLLGRCVVENSIREIWLGKFFTMGLCTSSLQPFCIMQKISNQVTCPKKHSSIARRFRCCNDDVRKQPAPWELLQRLKIATG